KTQKVEEVTNVNFNISVGAVVPASVRFHPLPPRIVEIYPAWRGYGFILVRGKYTIVRPQTHEIVYIIEGKFSLSAVTFQRLARRSRARLFAHRLPDRFPGDALQAVSSFDQYRVRFSGTSV